jgi:hypothetical protein
MGKEGIHHWIRTTLQGHIVGIWIYFSCPIATVFLILNYQDGTLVIKSVNAEQLARIRRRMGFPGRPKADGDHGRLGVDQRPWITVLSPSSLTSMSTIAQVQPR